MEGVDRYRVMEPMFECARVVMHHRGDRFAPAYVQGIAGTAFTIGGICPCAPTCVTVPRTTSELLALFGYEVTPVHYRAQAPEAEAEYAAFLQRLAASIAAGRPVITWHAFTYYEWDVVCGYREATGELVGYGSYAGGDAYAVSPQDRPKGGMDVTDTIALLVGEKTGTFDATVAEVEALRFAVEHAHSQKNAARCAEPEWVFLEGFLCYQRWARDFGDPARRRSQGDSYCLGVLDSTRRCAAAFVGDLAARYPVAAGHLRAASEAFTREAETLAALKPWLGWDAPEEPDAGRNAQVSALLERAAEQYRQAIGRLESALPLVG